MTELTPEQIRNRKWMFGVLRAFAGLFALLMTVDIVRAIQNGYIKLGIGDSRGPTRDYILLDTPFGFHAGLLFLESIAVYLWLVALAPRFAMRPRGWVPTLAVIVVPNVVLGVFFR